MKLSDRGIAFIKQWESCSLKAYLCSAGVWTIGWGHTGAEVTRTTTWSQAKADFTFLEDVREYENIVDKYVTVPLTQNQYDALVAFAFNVGGANFRMSTLVRKVNGRDFNGAQAQFKRWNKAFDPKRNMHVSIKGLTNRREAERQLFNEKEPV